MKNTAKQKKVRFPLFSLRSYLAYFLMSAFMLTVNIMMFLTLNGAMIDMDFETSKKAASATFFNVVFLSLVFSVIGNIYKKATEEKTLKIFVDATDKIKKGDFSVRIEQRHRHKKQAIDVVVDNFNQMVEELGSLEQFRDDFIANVSHELKTPLSVIQNYAMLLQDPELTYETRTEYTKTISNASRNLSNLITNILKLNKIENQQIYPENTEYDLCEQIRGCLISFEDIWEEKNIEVVCNLPDSVLITADEELMSLVWNNLFSNAIKFTDDGGTITVEMRTGGGKIEVDVTDTGCGMSADVIKHIFEKFYQGDTSHSVSGNGLGLALVKRVVDISGGEIRVKSAPGEGSTFSVLLKPN